MDSQVSSKITLSTGGFPGLLTIAFIVLKLTHVIDWSWFWVISPIVFGFVLFILIFFIVILIYAASD